MGTLPRFYDTSRYGQATTVCSRLTVCRKMDASWKYFWTTWSNGSMVINYIQLFHKELICREVISGYDDVENFLIKGRNRDTGLGTKTVTLLEAIRGTNSEGIDVDVSSRSPNGRSRLIDWIPSLLRLLIKIISTLVLQSCSIIALHYHSPLTNIRSTTSRLQSPYYKDSKPGFLWLLTVFTTRRGTLLSLHPPYILAG